MNHLIFKKISDFEQCSNPSERCIRINHALEFVSTYYATAFYCHTKQQRLVSRELVELIQTNFNKRNPLTSSWLKLLTYSVTLLKIKISFTDVNLNKEIQLIAKYFLPDSSKKEVKDSPSLKDICDCISIIRSKGFAHANTFSKDCLDFLIEHSFDKLPYYLTNCLSNHDSSKLYLADVICSSLNDGQEHSSFFFDMSSEIIKTVSIKKSEQFDFENIYSKYLYCFFPNSRNFISLTPFFLHRDGNNYVYSGIDNKSHPVFSDIASTNNISVKIYEDAFNEIIKDDIDLLNTNSIPVKLKCDNNVYHNIPSPPYERFIGRSDSISKVLKALANRRIFLIGISGIGGVGKSAIAIKVATDLFNSSKPMFSYLIWVSAKRTHLSPEGIMVSDQVFTNLTQLLDIILKTTGFQYECNLTYLDKKAAVIDVLSLDKFLVIVDNFETVNNPQEFLSFFEEIGDKCHDSKILLTTRHQLGSSEKVVDLREFTENEYHDFVRYLANSKYFISKRLDDSIVEKLYQITGGLALATEYIVGQLANSDKNPMHIIERFTTHLSSKDNILDFSFTESFNLLSETDKKVLFAISLLDTPVHNSISFLTGLDEFDVDESISKLTRYSFINVNEDNQYSLLPLTKAFLNTKLEKAQALHDQLVAKYNEYVFITLVSEEISSSSYAIENIISKDNIALRFAKAAFIMAKQGNFTKSEEYFNQAVGYDAKNSQVWLYWATASRDFSNTLKDDYFTNAIKYSSESDKENIMLEYGRALSSVGRDKDCIEVLEKVTQFNPNNHNAYHLLGKAYYDIGRNLWKKCEYHTMKKYYLISTDYFLKSIYNNPDSHFEKNSNAIAYYYLAKIARFQRDFKNALEYVEMGLLMQPHNFKFLDFKDDISRCQNK